MMASCRILAQCGCVERIERVMLASASREFVRSHRARSAGIYFDHWRSLKVWVRRSTEYELRRLEQHGEWFTWLCRQWTRLRAAFYLAVLALLGHAYRLGWTIDPRPILEKLTSLF
jgi:hypothetical protein